MHSEQLYVFGTGNAQSVNYYNTCFAMKDGEEFFMIDAGGGNGILKILRQMEVPLSKIHHVFVTHEHTDHILGIVWLIRMTAAGVRQGSYEGDAFFYCHEELISTIDTLCRLTIQGKFYKLIGDRIHLVPVADGDAKTILDHDITFFDIRSTKAKQFGFTTTLRNGKKLSFTGDEPCCPDCRPRIQGSHWLLHEAFCLYSERARFKPYEKNHSTVKEACELAESLQIPNLLLWHTEDSHEGARRQLYEAEGRAYYHGNLLVPDDQSIIDL